MLARGPLSRRLIATLFGGSGKYARELDLSDDAASALAAANSMTTDEDIQLSLVLLYSVHYGSLAGISAEWEGNPGLLQVRHVLEHAWESELRASVEVTVSASAERSSVARALAEMTAPSGAPGLAQFVATKATQEQAVEFLKQRSLYTLREADPHSWAIPRLTGRAKSALVEIQADEYGGGRADSMHSAIFARAMTGCGLSAEYGRYLDELPAITLASLNLMSMFGLNRRLIGAIVGHLAAYEMTSSIPNALYSRGFSRLGYPPEVTEYFDIHVEADAVHEQIAAHDLAGSLAEDEPRLLDDILFGAAACLAVDGMGSANLLEAFSDQRSSLRDVAP